MRRCSGARHKQRTRARRLARAQQRVNQDLLEEVALRVAAADRLYVRQRFRHRVGGACEIAARVSEHAAARGDGDVLPRVARERRRARREVLDRAQQFVGLAAAGAREAVEIMQVEEGLDLFVRAFGDVIGDINRRRGSIQDQLERGANIAVVAKVPLSEMFGYIGQLRAMSSGRASYTMEFSHYDPVPRNVADEVIEASKKPTAA